MRRCFCAGEVCLLLIVLSAQLCFGQSERAIEATELGNLQNYYATRDPHYARIVAQLPALQSALTDLKTATGCTSAVEIALRRTTSAIQSSEQPQYGLIRALVTIPGEDDENRLAKVLACVPDPRLQTLAQNIQEEFDLIDLAEAKKKARRALRKVVEEQQAAGSCEGIDLEQAGLKVRSIRIKDPFAFLPWVKARQRRAADQITTLIKDKPFTYTDASAKALDIIENENFLPDTSDARVKLRVEIVSVANCTDGGVDLVYGIYSTQIMPVLSARPETRVKERETPQTAAGQTTVETKDASPFHFTPVGSYDFTNLLSGGGRFEYTPRKFFGLPFKSAVIKGEASSRMHNISGALEAAYDSDVEAPGWLAHASWLLNFSHYSLPTGAGNIKGGHLIAHLSGVSKPLAGGNLSLRFGAAVDGGNRQTEAGSLILPPNTVLNAGFGTVKLYGAVDSRFRRNIFSATYALELGSIGPAARIDWRKHIVDARHQFWYSFGNHHLLDLESRFTAGRLQVPGRVPLPERFFGGNNEEFLIGSDDWQIRANPVIRAIPGRKFFQTPDGAGGKEFFSYNFTAAYGIWRQTLVPEELTTDDDFKSELDGAITTVTSTLQNYYSSKDPHYTNVVSQLPAAQTALTDLKTVVANAQAAHADQFADLFKACTRAVNLGLRRMNQAITPAAGDQYSSIASVLSDDEDDNELLKVNVTCERDLNGALQDETLRTATTRVETLRMALTAEFGQIDQAKSEKKASADMAFTRRSLNTLFKDVNIYSISPVFVFDVARIGPRSGSIGGTRYGPGAGIRLELATTAHFTLGYAFNVKRGPGEGRGNLFFAIGIRDLFY
jgi:hypothetical protein